MSADVTALRALLDSGAQDGTYPAAQASVFHDGREVFSHVVGQGITRDTAFDLASLTKVLCTGPLALCAWAEGKGGPETPLSRFLPGAGLAKANATIGDLLYHRSGAPAWVPFFMPVLRAVPELRAIDCPPRIRLEVRHEVAQAALAAGATTTRGEKAIYSDVGFIVLGELLAQLYETPLDRLFAERIATPLGLSTRFHRLSTFDLSRDGRSPATGDRRPREAAPGQDGGWEALGWLDSRAGEVDDDNAWVLDGVAGHAGLFGTAHDVARFGQAVLEELDGANRFAPALLWQRALQRDPQTPGSTRAMAFDTPSSSPTEPSSAGRWLAASASSAPSSPYMPPNPSPRFIVGHLGFTGTSLWLDSGRKLVVALCTNRTLLGRTNVNIRSFRPRFHDAVVEALGLMETSNGR